MGWVPVLMILCCRLQKLPEGHFGCEKKHEPVCMR
jgi:hypothetical protein